MKKGFGLVGIVIVVGLLIMTGAGVTAAYIISKNNSRKLDPSSDITKGKPGKSVDQFGQLDQQESNSPKPTAEHPPTPGSSPVSSPAPASEFSTYSQPQGLYVINLPAGWIVNSTFATKTYSTTKFVGPAGSISITFGDGKDPIGGCSESSAITLSDRIIPGCLLLQKDGTRILTRAYTKDKAGLLITVEAFISAPLSTNQPQLLSVIKTIDVY